jgi:hypothetical protein
MKQILEKLGCPACCSGHDIYLELQRTLVLRKGPGDEVQAFPAVRDSILKREVNTVAVGINPELVNNIDEVFRAIDRIADLSGHSACATGCDLFFQLERNFVINPRLEVIEEQLVMR